MSAHAMGGCTIFVLSALQNDTERPFNTAQLRRTQGRDGICPRTASDAFLIACSTQDGAIGFPNPRGGLRSDHKHRSGTWRVFETVEYATLQGVDWFNNRRILEPVGNITPAEAEQHFYAAMDQILMAA